VKVRGHRVELGEVEAHLSRHPGVREAAVTIMEQTPGDTHLVAHIVPRVHGDGVVGDLRARLRAALPDHLVPTRFVVRSEMPRTPNGKLDRRALSAAAPFAATAEAPGTPPENALEETIAAAWKDVLQRESVSVQDNFFDLGGHSLLAVRVHTRLRTELQRDISITDLFRFPTIRALAGYLAGSGGDRSAIRTGVGRVEARRAAHAKRPVRRAE
jgi:acyl carrier protein